MRIAVVGAGTAGCAACLFLSRAGHEVTLFEAVENPSSVGTGLLLQPTGMHVLDRLGLLEPVLEKGARITRLRGVTPKGRVVMDLPYERLRPGLFGLGVHRGLLFSILFGALDCRVETGINVLEIDGARLIDDRGSRHGPFDLVVVADGSRSALRERSGLLKRLKPHAWAALWCIARDEQEAGQGDQDTFHQEITKVFSANPSLRRVSSTCPTLQSISVITSPYMPRRLVSLKSSDANKGTCGIL